MEIVLVINIMIRKYNTDLDLNFFPWLAFWGIRWQKINKNC